MMMSTHQTTVISDHTLASAGTGELVETRFGDITIDPRNALSFPTGLLGMPHLKRFALANFPNPKMQQFKLLQSLDDKAMSFISLPLPLDNAILKRDDTLAACQELGVQQDNLVQLLIVCIHRTPDGKRLSANARAPIFIDADSKYGIQYVFMHDRYQVQHFIS